jgi:cytochrome P450
MATPLAGTGLDNATVPDLLDPNFYVDLDAMHESLRRLRRERPVARDEKNGLWAITRHADVVDVERNDRVFVSGLGYRSFESPDEDDMISLDDPRHAEQRKLIARRFTPKSVRGLEPLMAGIMDDLIGRWADRGELEVVSELSSWGSPRSGGQTSGRGQSG